MQIEKNDFITDSTLKYIEITKQINIKVKNSSNLLQIWGFINLFAGRRLLESMRNTNISDTLPILYLSSGCILGILMIMTGWLGKITRQFILILAGIFLLLVGFLNVSDSLLFKFIFKPYGFYIENSAIGYIFILIGFIQIYWGMKEIYTFMKISTQYNQIGNIKHIKQNISKLLKEKVNEDNPFIELYSDGKIYKGYIFEDKIVSLNKTDCIIFDQETLSSLDFGNLKDEELYTEQYIQNLLNREEKQYVVKIGSDKEVTLNLISYNKIKNWYEKQLHSMDIYKKVGN